VTSRAEDLSVCVCSGIFGEKKNVCHKLCLCSCVTGRVRSL